MSTTLETILSVCDGVKVKSETYNDWRGTPVTNTEFWKTGELKLPDGDIFIEITATATKGTIAKVVEIEAGTYGERYDHYKGTDNEHKYLSWDGTIIYEVEGRKQKGRIKTDYATVLPGHHQTEYVRNVNTHKKKEVKNPVNKYKQELQKGDWVIGVKPGRSLGIGRITRWTNHNVWAVSGDDITDKSKEFKFDTIGETFTMPDSEAVQQLLTMAILKGYTGG